MLSPGVLINQIAGNYNFGFIDPTEFTGSISFVDVEKDSGFWEFIADSFSVGNGPAIPMPHRAIADTGTTLLLLPEAIVATYYQEVPTSRVEGGSYVFGCNEILPDLTINIGTYKAVVPAELIMFAPNDQFNETCFGGVQKGGDNLSIYGDVFLKAHFTVFHGGESKLGFAPKPV